MEISNKYVPYQCERCGLEFELSKYRDDCYFYGEEKDMGAIIRYCTREEIEWGHCPCEKCDKFLSTRDADRIIRKHIESN